MHSEIRGAGLCDVAAAFREHLELRHLEPDARHAVDDRDRRGHRTVRAHHLLELDRDAVIVRIRQPVRDQRRLERDDRLLRFTRLCDLGAVLQLHAP